MRRLKVKVVGDSNVGKTCFLSRWYSESYSPQDGLSMFPKSVPPVQDSYFTTMSIDRVSYIVTYWDTCTLQSSDEFNVTKLRPLEYKETDVFVVCFDVSSPCSFQNVSTTWVPEVKHYMPGIPLLVVGNKKDIRHCSDKSSCMVSPSKGTELAERLGTVYCENSAKTGEGVREVIDAAVRLAIQHRNSETKKKRFKMFQRQKTTPKLFHNEVEPPLLPHPGPVPNIEVEESTFATDMRRFLRTSTCTDFTFRLASGPMEAHKVILCLSSQWFRDLLLTQTENLAKDIGDLSFTARGIPRNNDITVDTNCSEIGRSASAIQDLTNAAVCKALSYFLDFLYTGELNLSEASDELLVKNVRLVAKQLKNAELEETCENIIRKESFLNRSICAFVKDKRCKFAKELFVNKPVLSDVIFVIEDQRIFAHKAVVMARSDVMAAMLGGGFSESNNREVQVKDTSTMAFVAMLEYLYTDRLPDQGDISDFKQLLILADRFCLSRLRTLCELCISQKLNIEIRKRLHLGRETCEEVIDAFLMSQAHNAGDLHRWCAHIMTTNFTDFEFSEDLALLKPDDIKHVMEHRWPPLSYLNQLEEYKKKTGRT